MGLEFLPPPVTAEEGGHMDAGNAFFGPQKTGYGIGPRKCPLGLELKLGKGREDISGKGGSLLGLTAGRILEPSRRPGHEARLGGV